MKKNFDCVEMKNQLQEKLWIEGGETIDGLFDLIKKRRENNHLLKLLLERRKKQFKTA